MTNISSPVLYSERTLPSLGFYAATLFAPLAVYLISLPFSESVGLVAAMVAWVAVLVWSYLSAPLIVLTKEFLKVGQVRIETKYLGQATEIDSAQAFKERGPQLDTRAFTRFQIGVKTLIKIEIIDDADPTPYWLIASRNPEVLAGIISKL
jgi:hypothetical protein